VGRVLRALRRKLQLGRLEREDYSTGKRVVGNTDAMAAAEFNDHDFDPQGGDGGFIPPNYVPPVDEGRPRK
jgi:hypothetical protein